MQAAEITYTHKKSEYTVTLEVDDLEFFEAAAQNGKIVSRQGEDLVRALVYQASKDKLAIRVTRRKDGRLNDGPGGKPAEEKFYPDGKTEFSRHYKDGKLHDGEIIIPNEVKLLPDDSFELSANYKEGEKPLAWTVAAVEEFHANGSLRKMAFYQYGVLNNHAPGEPAILELNDKGEAVYLAYYENGRKTGEKFKELLDKEHAARAKASSASNPKRAP